MGEKKIIAICQSGGVFETDKDGTMAYKGGDAHAIDISEEMKFLEFKAEISEVFNYDINTISSFKYFLPGNKKTPITISNDKDLQRMVKFHDGGMTVDIYVIMEAVALDVSRSSGTTSMGVAVPVNPPIDVMKDANSPDDPFIGPFDILVDTASADVNMPTESEIADVNMPTESEIALTVPSTSSADEKCMKAAQQWQHNITGVGQRFNSVHEFREALRKYAIAHQFAFKYKKNDSHRVTVKCKAEGCPWRIHASRLSTTQLICIKKMNSTHTCDGAAGTTGYQATRSWVASIIKEKLMVFPNYKPKDIVNDIKQEFGIELNYFQAWRGKEIAKEQLQGSYKEAYNQLPILCEKIMESNPGSLATFTTKDDSSFHRLFVSFHASLYGFQHGCRSLLFLDSIVLKSKYQGTLLAATAADADDGVFPVAFAVVDTENEDNWRFFLLQLKSVLLTSHYITFVADRRLKEPIEEIFEYPYHAHCVRYLSEELIGDLKEQFSHEVKRILVEDLYAAAYAPKIEGFQRHAENIKSISLEAYNWIMERRPNDWANAYFRGSRYNHLTSNFGEIFYGWASDAHDLPITQMIDVIRDKLAELIHSRRIKSNEWTTKLTPSMEKKLEVESLKVASLQVLPLPSFNIFEVRDDASVEMVDMNLWSCSCRVWEFTGLPCCHAQAVIASKCGVIYDYCIKFVTTDIYRLIYSESIHPVPVPSSDQPLQNDSSHGLVTVTPPPTRRPPGRPTKKQTISNEVGRKRQLQCSICKGVGHNKSTCKEIPAASLL